MAAFVHNFVLFFTSVVARRVQQSVGLIKLHVKRALPALCGLLAILVAATSASATTFTMAVPGTSLTLPATYPQAGGVAIVLEGANGNVYYQFINPSTMFQGFQNTGTPVAWQGNPFQIGPVMALNCGPVVSCSTYLGGSISRMTIRFTAYDGDNQAGMFDVNDLNLRINGANFGASTGNWSVVATQNTSLDGLTLISSNTGFGNNTFDTGWFQSTDTTILTGVLSSGTVTATIFDRDPNDNFWDFKRGNDAVTSVVPLNVAPGVTIDKASTTTSFTTVGTIIPYTFTIRNIGSVWINPVNVVDPKVTGVSCPALPAATTVNLDPGEQIICTANYSVTQADVDAGVINNTATASGTPQAGVLGPVSDTNSIPGPVSAPGVLLAKTATPSPFGLAGTTLTYSFAVQNTGNVTLNNIAITDPSLASLSCTSVSIAPGATVTLTCTGNTRTITQANVDTGSLANTATVSARAPNGSTVTNPSSITTLGPARSGGIALVKSAGTITDLDSNGPDVGDTITYTFVVSNTGNVTLTSVGVTDPKVGPVTCPVSALLPAASTTCTKTYTLTQADVDAGNVTNTATASGTPPSGVAGPVTDVSGSATTNNDPTVTSITRTPALFLDKTSPTANFNAVGAVITYSYLVRNSGNVTLSNAITISDDKATVSCPALPGGILAPTSSITCSASHTVTQADIDAGQVLNTAIANTTYGATPVASPSDQVTVPAVQARSMTVDKNATAVNFINPGDTVSYEYIVTNTGNTTLNGPVTVSDNKVTSVNCPPGNLAPGSTLTCTATYSVLLEDLQVGSITNLATASSGTTTSPQVSRTVPGTANPTLTVSKTTTTANFDVVGNTINYNFLVTNSGSSTLTKTINIIDNKIGTIVCWVPPTNGPQANRVFTPGETLSCTGSYVVTQADIDGGFVTNEAFAATTFGATNIPVTSPPDTVTVNALQNPQLTTTKSVTTLPITTLGQVLTYRITVANTGDTTISAINITDPLIPTLSCSIATLAPGGSNNSCTGTYTVQQADFNAGTINNTATASGITPQGVPVTDPGTLNTPITQVSSLVIAKTYGGNTDNDASGTISLGDTLTYSITVTNDGNITQNNVVVSDPLLSPNSLTCASVVPGATCILTGSLNVSQTQVNAGTVANTGRVTSTLLPTPETVVRNVPVPQISSLAVDKVLVSNADQDLTGTVTRNDTLTYRVTATNTGNITQSNVVVADAQLTPNSQTCPSVAPGATCVLTGTKIVSLANVDAGVINNIGRVTSTLITTPVTDPLSTPVAQTPSLLIVKSLFSNADQDISGSITRNDTLTFRVRVTNDGSVTQSNVVVTDALLTPSSQTCPSVAPGATCILSGTLTVTQAHVDAGNVNNTGSVTSTGLPTAETVILNTPITQTRAITVDKTSPTTNFDAVGDVVSYSYVIRNTGNVTLSGAVSIADSKTTVSCPVLPLAGLVPNATHTCTATYSIQQLDLDEGFVLNTATATVGTTVSPSDLVNVPAVQNPALTIDKTSSTASFDAVGDVLAYSYVLRNTGNVTLTGTLVVSDNKTSVSCAPMPPLGLAPNQTLSCSASYTVQQADINNGSVINIASAEINGTTSPTDQVTVPAVQNRSISLDKRWTSVTFIVPGDTVTYDYVVRNTGNTTLVDPVTVIDNRVTPVNCPPLPGGELVPGGSITCTSTYNIVLADLEIGSVTNIATATSGLTVSNQDSELVPSGAQPALDLVKSTSVTSFNALGDSIPYSFTITNTGNATFTKAINIVDDKIGTIACWTPTGADQTFLPVRPVNLPAESVTCTANYLITQADLDRGFLTNQAFADTTYSAAFLPVTSGTETVTINATQDPALTVTKSATTLPVASVGQVLTYTITTANTGDLTLSGITVVDPLIPTLSCSIASLAPGASQNCVGTYTVSQADFNAGQILNTATANGITPQGVGVSDTGSTTVPITQVISVAIAKAFVSNADQDVSSSVTLDDTLNYRVTVSNDGNVTQNNVVVNDPLLAPSSITCATLVPGGTCVLDGTLSVTQARVDAGTVANTATVTTTLLPTPETANRSVPVAQQSAMSIDKQIPVNGDQDVGGTVTLNDVLTYTVVMVNTGTVTQNAVVVSDPLLTPTSKTCAAVAPGDTCILKGTLTVTQAHVNAGSIANTASVVSSLITTALTDGVITPVAQNSSVAIAKLMFANADGDTSSSITRNDVLTYKVTMTNDGTVTQNNVLVSDVLLTPASTTCATVAPGGTCILTGTYTVTQANVDAGSIGNTGSVTTTLLPTSETVVISTLIPQVRSLAVNKTSPTANYDAVGDVITYSYVLTNTGNVTLSGTLTASDNKTTVSCPALPALGLAPGASHTCSATYPVTQADLNNGSITNTASARIGTTTSPSDQATVPAVQLPALTVDKTSPTASFNAVNALITYSYVVRNAGNVALTKAITITDNKATVTCPALPAGTLAPGATITCSATHTVTQADIDNGLVLNTATANTTYGPGNTPVASPSDQVSVPAVQTRSMTIDKTATSVKFINIGDLISYRYVITNTGNTTLNGPFTVSDNRVSTVNCPVGNIAPTRTLTCTGSYAVVFGDLDLGSVTNLATASNATTTSPLDSVTVPPATPTALTIVKTSSTANFDAVNDTVAYRFAVTNTGGATLTRAVTVTDNKIGTITCWTPTGADPTFIPTETAICTANYTVVQADLDRGFVTNEAFAATTYGAANIPVTSAPASVTVNAVQAPSLNVVKSVATLPVTAAGQVLTYTITATNNGTVTLSSVVFSDPLIPSMSCTVASIAPAAAASCTGTYTVSQTNFDTGVINNTATAAGITPQGAGVSDTGTLSTLMAAAKPKLTLDKVAATTAYANVGDTLSFGFTVTNSGDVTLNNVVVTDPLVPTFRCTIATLAPGAVNSTCVTSYRVTQADINAGQVNNTASVSANAVRGINPTATDTATVTGPLRVPSASIDKTATPATYAAVGAIISYSYKVTNTGNTSLTGALTVKDNKVPTVVCPALPIAGLAPGSSLTCTASHTITQANLDAGSITNTATTSANSSTGAIISPADSATVTAIPAPAITVVKNASTIADNDGNGQDAGDTISYSFVVNNPGNLTLKSLTITDPQLAGAIPPVAVVCPVTTLSPGASTTCRATYILTQANIDAGSVTNSATASASPPLGSPVSDISGSTTGNNTPTTNSIISSPAIAVIKSAGAVVDNDGNGADPGDTIAYTFTVSNQGNVTLASVAISDAKISGIICPITTLAPGISTVCSGTYTLLLADVNEGKVVNTATASGTSPSGRIVSDQSGSSITDNTPTTAPIEQKPAVTVVKAAGPVVDLDGNGADVGDRIVYTFTVSNPGNVTLTALAVIDAKTGPVVCPLTVLLPGANMSCSAIYILKQADIDAGTVTNTAIASGRTPGGATITDTSGSTSGDDVPTIKTIPQNPALGLVKTNITASFDAVGDGLSYSYVVRNTGTVTITNAIAITDDKTTVNCPALPGGALAPGKTITCSANYTVVQADIDNGSVINTASAATTYGPGNAPVVSPAAQATVPAVQSPAMVVAKSATTVNFINVGDIVSYRYVITNTGNTTLNGPFNVSDNRVTSVNCPVGIIAPQGTMACTGSYAVTLADLDFGSVTNLASGSNGTTTSPLTSVTIPPGAPTALVIAKASTTANFDAVGDNVVYQFTVTNAGSRSFTRPITVTDDKIGIIACWTPTAGDPTFTPTEKATCSATYVILQDDLDRGFVTNDAFTSTTYGKTNLPVASAPTSLTVNALQKPLLDVKKSAATLPVAIVGQVLTYSITATNTGNITLTNVQITDPLIPALSCTEPSLAVSAVASCSGTYVVSQDDFDAGVLNNTATSTGNTPQGNPVTHTGSNSVTIAQSPAITLVKTAGDIADLDGNGADAGDQITYDFLVSNTGDVTLQAIAITDPKVGAVTCPTSPLAPGLSTLCQATYTLLLSDVNKGSVTNTAKVSAQPPFGNPVTDVSGSAGGNDTPTVSTIPSIPRITLVKSASQIADIDGNGPDVGDTIVYSFKITNSGNQTLTGVSIDDPLFAPTTVACVASTLAPAASTNCAATYVLTQSDVDRGNITNSATAFGLSPSSTSVADASGTLSTNDDPTFSGIPRVSSLALSKASGAISDPDGNGVDAGDTVSYTFQVRNTGNQTLTNVTVTDAKATVSGSPIAILLPGVTDTTSYTATYVLTQRDVDAGTVQNTALVRATPPTGPPATDTSGTDFGNDTPTDKPLPASPSMTLVKTTNGITDTDGNGHDVGDTVSYTFTARNTGNVTLSNVAINDPLVGLAALEGSNSTATLLAMAATDFDPLTTASTTQLVAPLPQPEGKSLPAQVSEFLFGAGPGAPEIATALSVKRTLVRLQPDARPLAAGDRLGIYFTLVNAGEGPLTTISAEQQGAELLGSGLEILPANAAYILPAVYTYTLTSADIDAGQISAPATLNFRSRAQALSQSVESPLALADVELQADLLTGSITPALVATLAPGQTATFSGTYQLTQADVDAGGVDNTATIAGRAPDGSSAGDTSGTTETNDTPTGTTIDRTPAIAMVKSAADINDKDNNGPDLGDTILYSFDVKNLGNVTLSGIAITDAKVGAVSCPQVVIASASNIVCTANYTLTQADVDAGNVTNTAKVTGTAPGNTPVQDTSGGTITDDIPTVSVIPRKGGLTLVKIAGAPTTAQGLDAAMTDVDDTIDYEFVLQNIGNVTLTPISIADAKIPSISCPVNVLAPTESTTCTGTYTLLLADFDLGTLQNTAIASGATPDDQTSTDVSGTNTTNDTPTQTILPQTARMTVVKSAGTPTTSGGANAVLVDAGDTIEYSFLVANTGNVTLNDIAIADDKVPDVKCPVPTLVPGADTTCTGTYTLTQADLDLGQVDNTATGTGSGPSGITTSDPSGTDTTNDTATQTPLPQVALIALVKTASPFVDVDGNGVDIGDTIQYNFAVTNQGNVTLAALKVTDEKIASIACPSATLAPATTITCTGIYTLKQDDLDAGQVENQALATGTPPSGTPVTDLSDPQTPGQGPGENDKTITSLTQRAAMTVVKLADISGLASPPQPGNKIKYSFAIRNAGNVTLTDITLVDILPKIVRKGGPIAKLLPDNTDSTTFKAEYTITAADISAGFIENSATATGNFKNPLGEPQSTSDTSGTDATNDTPTRVLLTAVPRISIVKKAKFNEVSPPTGASLGDTITYTFTVANMGNVQLTDIKIADPMLSGISCDKTTLDVGENTACSANVYALNQDDINAGEVRNQATVSSTAIVEGEPTATNDESGTSGSNDEPTITGLPFVQPTFTKTASKSVVKLGETITFTIKATSVVFRPADIIDQLPGGLSYVPNSAIVNGVEVDPIISGRRLTFNNITPIANNITISLRAVVNASATDGPLTNRVQLIHPNGSVVAEAKATVEVRPDPVFDCGDIIGKVFDDANSNGIQDAATSPYVPERGLPGVRVVTVNGTLITTDKNGKFHIACADIPNAKVGSNFILKLDPRSLPSGYRMTTENPRVVRLTRGKLSKINFGASISRVIKLDLTDKVFTSGGIVVSQKLKAAILRLVDVLDEEPSVVRLQYHLGSEGKAIATRRLKLISEFIAASWEEKGGRYKLPVEQRLLLGKQQGALQ